MSDESRADGVAAARPGAGSRYGIPALVVGVAAGLYILVFCWLCCQMYLSFGYLDWDLATYSQLAYKSVRLDFSPVIPGINYYGNHLHVLFFLMGPLYGLFPSPYTLLVVQTLALAAAAIPLYLVGRREAGAAIAVGLCLAYLLHPAVHHANLNDYHPETLLPFLFLWAFYFMLTGRVRGFVVAGVACAFLKENYALIVMMLGLYAGLRHRMRSGWALAGFGLAWFLLVLLVAIPWMGGGLMEYSNTYGALGSDLPSLARNLVLHPLTALGIVSEPRKLVFLSWLLLPLALLPLLGWRTLWLTLPMMAQHLLSSRDANADIRYYYTIEILPTLLVSAVYGAQWLRDRLGPRAVPAIAFGLPVAALVSTLMVGPFAAPYRTVTRRVLTYDYLDAEKDRLVRRIPDRAGAVASFEFLPRLANRKELYSFHYIVTGVLTGGTLRQTPFTLPDSIQYMLVDVTDPIVFQRGGYYRPDAYVNILNCIRRRGFEIEDFSETLLLFRKGNQGISPVVRTRDRDDVPAPVHRVNATVAGDIELIGFDIRSTARPEVQEWDFHWRSLRRTSRDINTCIDLVDGNGRLLLRKFHPLGYRLRPTQSWAEGERLDETVRLVLPTPDSGLRYELRMGFIEAATGEPCAIESAGPVDSLGRITLRGGPIVPPGGP